MELSEKCKKINVEPQIFLPLKTLKSLKNAGDAKTVSGYWFLVRMQQSRRVRGNS
jgi:hypothetical protein